VTRGRLSHMSRRKVISAAAGLGAAAAVALFVPGAVATTGDGTGLKPPQSQPEQKLMSQYIGLFEVDKIDRRARISGAEIAVDYTELPPVWPYGHIVVRGYDADGKQTSWTGALYNFAAKGDHITGEILNQGDLSIIGHIEFFNPSAEHVNGYIKVDGQSYQFHANKYDDDDGPPPDQHVVQTGPTFKSATQPGWEGAASSVVGRYSIVNAATDPGAGSAIFAPIVRLTKTVGTEASNAPTGGSLNITGTGTNLTGVLKLQRMGTGQTYYLSSLKSGGTSRSAEVHTGSASGPSVGTFKGTLVSGELTGTITTGSQKTDISFASPGSTTG
jgi:hypothetical protein